MLSEWIKDLETKAYAKNWDDFLIMAVILYGVGSFIFFLGWYRMPVLLDYILFIPPFILGSLAMMIYILFTKTI